MITRILSLTFMMLALASLANAQNFIAELGHRKCAHDWDVCIMMPTSARIPEYWTFGNFLPEITSRFGFTRTGSKVALVSYSRVSKLEIGFPEMVSQHEFNRLVKEVEQDRDVENDWKKAFVRCANQFRNHSKKGKRRLAVFIAFGDPQDRVHVRDFHDIKADRYVTIGIAPRHETKSLLNRMASESFSYFVNDISELRHSHGIRNIIAQRICDQCPAGERQAYDGSCVSACKPWQKWEDRKGCVDLCQPNYIKTVYGCVPLCCSGQLWTDWGCAYRHH